MIIGSLGSWNFQSNQSLCVFQDDYKLIFWKYEDDNMPLIIFSLDGNNNLIIEKCNSLLECIIDKSRLQVNIKLR